jgi:hypothetical protein
MGGARLSKLSRKTRVLLVACLCIAVAGTTTALVMPHGTMHINGSAMLNAVPPVLDSSCDTSGSSMYSDVHVGSEVVVKDGSGDQIATGTVGSSRLFGEPHGAYYDESLGNVAAVDTYGCSFAFEVDVPKGHDEYTFEVGGHTSKFDDGTSITEGDLEGFDGVGPGIGPAFGLALY